MTLVLGVDACPGGWVGVELHDGRFAAAHFDRELPQLVRSTPDAAAIAVDIPLGLADEDWRDADAAAKKFLGKRSSSVFMTPPKVALAQETHALGVARCRELTGKGFSIQAWGLKTKLLEANSLYESGDHPMWEVHPRYRSPPWGCRPVTVRRNRGGAYEHANVFSVRSASCCRITSAQPATCPATTSSTRRPQGGPQIGSQGA